MAFKRLLSEEMLQLSATWVDPKSKAHEAILATPDLAPSMSRLTSAHNVLASLAQPASADPRLAAISQEEAIIDPRHDDIIRGGHSLLTSAAFLLGSEGAGLLALRDTLFPDGLSSTQKSYRAEAGQAARDVDDRAGARFLWWSWWRRHHQALARICHYRRRGALPPDVQL